MPKFIVTRDSYFRPLDYAELVRPVAHMQEVHNATQDAYDKLNLESSALRQYISDNPEDSDARALYDSYMTNLDRLQENLWKHGVSAQTRRDLSAARAGYASDITRLAAAIQSRQERSKAYWDMKHAHPDMVMGADPGLSGLNEYLKDANYGQNYYTYSGEAFMNEVAADAKARASEMLRMPQYANNPQAAGYLMRISQEGYTSKEVQDASNAVRKAIADNNPDLINNLDGGAGILANVLMSHLNSTGAKGQVTPEEFNRLVDYGSFGLSQAIGRSSVTDLNDKAWDYRRQVALASMRGGGSGSGAGQQTSQIGRGYTINSLVEQLTSPTFDKTSKRLRGKYKKFENGPIMVATPEGTSETIESPFEMARLIYNPDSRKRARQVFNGLDIANLKSGQTVSIEGADGEMHTLTVKKQKDGTYGLVQDDGVLNTEASDRLNIYVTDYNDHINKYKQANPGLNIDDYAVPPEEEFKDREERGWSGNIDSDDYESLLMTTEVQGDYTPATLLSTEKAQDDLRANIGRAMVQTYKRAASNSGGKLGKGDRFAFYEVGEGGMRKSQKGETDIAKVFGSKKDGTISPDNAIAEVTLRPESVAAGVGTGRPTVQFTTSASGKVWETDAAALGSAFYKALKEESFPAQYNWSPQMQKILGVKCPSGAHGVWSNSDAVYYMMEPIMNPAEALSMTPEQQRLWTQIVYTILNGDGEINPYDLRGPVINYPDGNFRLATPDDIVRSPELQSALRGDVTQFINDVMSIPRDAMMQQHMQSTSNTSTKAEPYLK